MSDILGGISETGAVSRGRAKWRDESFQEPKTFVAPFHLPPTDCPWFSQDECRNKRRKEGDGLTPHQNTPNSKKTNLNTFYFTILLSIVLSLCNDEIAELRLHVRYQYVQQTSTMMLYPN